MRKLLIALLLFVCYQSYAQIGVYDGKPRYSFLTIRDSDTIGNFTVEMYPTIAPLHVRNFDSLVAEQFFDSTLFHRVVPGFVIQGGDPNTKNGPRNTWGFGQPWQQTVPAEFNPVSHLRGIFSAARDNDINSANSQFFVCVAPATFLDWNYTAYGNVTSGMNVVDNIVASPAVSEIPNQNIQMFVTRLADDTSKLSSAANIIQPADNAVGISANYQFKWDALPGALIYELEISRDQNFATIDTVIKTNKTTLLVPTLLPGEVQYYWRLQANNGGYKKPTATRSFTTGAFPPSLVFPNNNQTLPTNTIDFSWDSVSGVSSYKIQIATNPNFTLASIKLEVDSIPSNMFFSILEPNKKHFWRVASELNGIPGGYSASRSFTTGAAVGFNSLAAEEFVIHPNPVSNILILDNLEDTKIEVYNSLGQLVLANNISTKSLDVSSLRPGMYMLRTEKGFARFVKE